MKMSGTGGVFSPTPREIHLLYLENDAITVNGQNLLAFDAGIDWDIKKVESERHGGRRAVQHIPAGQRTGGDRLGWPRPCCSTPEAPTFADPQAAITWASSLQTSIKTDIKLKNFIGRGSGVDPDGLLRPGLGAGPSQAGVLAPSGGVRAGAGCSATWAADVHSRRPAPGPPRRVPITSVREVLLSWRVWAIPAAPCAPQPTSSAASGRSSSSVTSPRARPLLRAGALPGRHQPADALAAPARAGGAGHRRAPHLPRGPPARGVLAHGEGPGAGAADRRHAPLRARVARRRGRRLCRQRRCGARRRRRVALLPSPSDRAPTGWARPPCALARGVRRGRVRRGAHIVEHSAERPLPVPAKLGWA